MTDGVIKQVNALKDGSQDLITISSGGNDAYLSDILNECVFQWYSDATPIKSLCDDQLAKAQAVIDSDDFHKKLVGSSYIRAGRHRRILIPLPGLAH